MTTFLRRYLTENKGALAELTKATKRSRTLISRFADGHRDTTHRTALKISELTGIPPQDLQAKVNTWKGKKATARGRGSR